MDIPEEVCENKTEFFNKLICVIDNQQSPIDTMTDGLRIVTV